SRWASSVRTSSSNSAVATTRTSQLAGASYRGGPLVAESLNAMGYVRPRYRQMAPRLARGQDLGHALRGEREPTLGVSDQPSFDARQVHHLRPCGHSPPC